MGNIIEIMGPTIMTVHEEWIEKIILQQTYIDTNFLTQNPKKGTFEKNFFRGKHKGKK